jgi:transposase
VASSVRCSQKPQFGKDLTGQREEGWNDKRPCRDKQTNLMGRIKVVELSEEQRQALEQEYRTGKTHSYRQRCKGVLLKSEKRSSAEVAQQLGCNEVTVNVWLKRFEDGGIQGLKTLSGRGRKPILEEADVAKVKGVVAEHRQKLSVAREELEQILGKSFSQDTLKRFVKKTLDVISESENVPSKSRVRTSTSSKSKG